MTFLDPSTLFMLHAGVLLTGVTVSEGGDFDEGDGIRVIMLPMHLIIQVRVEGEDRGMTIPMEDILQAVALMGKGHQA